MHHLFISQPVPLTSESMFNLFLSRLTPEGYNKREDEEQIVIYWNHFLELIKCKLIDKSYNEALKDKQKMQFCKLRR